MLARLDRGVLWSGIGHLTLILWLLLADWLLAPSANIEIVPTQVSMMSSAEFAAMEAAIPPSSSTAEQSEGASAAASARPEPRPQTRPEITAPTEPEIAPEPPAEDLPVAAEEQPIPSLSPTMRPEPKPADRVAPNPVSVPEEATPSPTPEESAPIEAVEEPPKEPPPPEPARETVPEESGDVLRTEATPEQEEALGMATSVRPRNRPERPAAAPVETQAENRPAPDTTQEAAEDNEADAIAAAVASAAAESPAGGQASNAAPASGASGPPLNAGEIGDIRSAIGNRWNLGAASSDVLSTVVVVRVQFDQSGKPVDIRLVESDAPTQQAADVAFSAARRAIQRAYIEGGIPLPPDKYESWKVLDFVFDANGMRIR